MSERFDMEVYNLATRSEEIIVYEKGNRGQPLCRCDDLAVASLIVDALNAHARRKRAMRNIKPTMAGVLRA